MTVPKTVISARKWRCYWNVLKRFSPGYSPGVNHMGQFKLKGRMMAGAVLSAEDAWWKYQERGEKWPCADEGKFREYYERAAGQTLTVEMWKAKIKGYQSDGSAFNRILVPQSIVLDLCRSYPISFLERVGLLKLVGLSVRQCGLRLGTDY